MSQEHKQEMEQAQKKRADWEFMKQELHQAPSIYDWTIQVKRTKATQAAIILVLFSFILGAGASFFTEMWGFFWGQGTVGLFLGSVVKFWGGADDQYHYHLTPKGIYYTKQRLVPKFFFFMVPIVAWVGVLICIVEAIVVGPMAFIGAGAMALMSFGLVNLKPKVPVEHIIYFAGHYTLFDLKDWARIRLDNDHPEPWSDGPIYCDFTDKKTVIEHLNSQIPHLKIVELRNDQEYQRLCANNL